jgi:glycerol-3-phosphate acyltransferase PlsY
VADTSHLRSHRVLASSPPAAVAVLLVAASYLVGTFPTALLVGRRRGVDPTTAGSGNPGATNVLRVAGRRAGALALIGDLAKGAVPAAAGWAVGGHGLGLACGVAAVVGHVAPVIRRFRGGKGVATGVGMAVVLFPVATGVAAAAFALTVAATRMVSLASIVGVAVLPGAAAAFGASLGEVGVLAGCAVLIVARHRSNIARLLAGTERRVGGTGPPHGASPAG